MLSSRLLRKVIHILPIVSYRIKMIFNIMMPGMVSTFTQRTSNIF